MWWLCLFFTLISGLTPPETPHQFARKCKTDKNCQAALINGLDQFWNLSISHEKLNELNDAYDATRETASLPRFLKDPAKLKQSSIYRNLCPTMLDVASESAHNYSYTKCDFKNAQTCVFAMKLGEELPVFDAHCSDINKVVGVKNCTEHKCMCWHNYFTGVYLGTGCCARNGMEMIKSHLSQAFFSDSGIGVEDVIKDSTKHGLQMIKHFPKKVSASVRYSLFGVFLTVFTGLVAGMYFLYKK